MSPLRARVEKGRLVLDEPTTLPEGTVVQLVADDEGDDLTDEERRALHAALTASWKSAEAGHLRPASDILDELRSRVRGSGPSEPGTETHLTVHAGIVRQPKHVAGCLGPQRHLKRRA